MTQYDLIIFGGGIHGTASAVDAAGRGLKTLLLEKGDLGGQTTQYSTQLIHGGLRYLDRGLWKLVKEGLSEQRILMQNASYLVQPLEFIFLQRKTWHRPAWLTKIGLSLYDAFRSHILPRSHLLSRSEKESLGLNLSEHHHYWSFFDAQVQANHLVLSDAILAQDLGATILSYAQPLAVRSTEEGWQVRYEHDGQIVEASAKVICNLTGPWINEFFETFDLPFSAPMSLVQGSHLLLKHRLETLDKALAYENKDRRLVFFIPKGDLTLVGTTDKKVEKAVRDPSVSTEEKNYLLNIASTVLGKPFSDLDIQSSYAGIRCLPFDEKAGAATSRELQLFDFACPVHGHKAIAMVGGKLTSARKTAEEIISRCSRYLSVKKQAWTQQKHAAGAKERLTLSDLTLWLEQHYPFLDATLRTRLARSYGMRCAQLLHGVFSLEDLGPMIVRDLSVKEVQYLMHFQWVCSFEDLIERRLGWGAILSKADRKKAYTRFIKYCSTDKWESSFIKTLAQREEELID